METIKASSKGQIVIPKAIREHLAIKPGTELAVEVVNEHSFNVQVANRLSHEEEVDQLAGSLAHLKRGRRGSARTDDEAIMKAVREDDARTRTKRRRR